MGGWTDRMVVWGLSEDEMTIRTQRGKLMKGEGRREKESLGAVFLVIVCMTRTNSREREVNDK